MPEIARTMAQSYRRLGPLAGIALPERRAVEGAVGIELSVVPAASIVQAEAGRGRAADFRARVEGRFGGWPEPGRALEGDPVALHTGPDTLVFVAEGRGEGALAAELRDLLGDTASVFDVSHGRCLIRLGGPKARDLLAFGTGIDLGPDAFAPHACAATLLGHVAATLHLRSPAPEFDIVAPRAFAESLWHWLLGRARMFGYEVR